MTDAYSENRVLTVFRGHLVYARKCQGCEHDAHKEGKCSGIDWGANGKEPWGCSCDWSSPPLKRVDNGETIEW